MKKTVTIDSEFIKLGQFLKYVDAVASGAEAKAVILNGEVSVNGKSEKQRGKKLRDGDQVKIGNDVFLITGDKRVDS